MNNNINEDHYRQLLGKSLIALAQETLGAEATLKQMATLATEKIGIEYEDARAIIFECC